MKVNKITEEEDELLNACSIGNIRRVEQLLDAGVDINCEDYSGNNPLLSAARHGHFSIVKSLLERGADKTAQDDLNRTASVVARNLGKNDIADYIDSWN